MSHLHSTTQSLAFQISKLRAGDPAARKALLERSGDRLLVMARRLRRKFRLDPVYDTQDVWQEAAIRLMRALEDVEIVDVRHFLNLSAMKIRQTLIDLARRPVLPKHKDCADDSDAELAINQAGTLTLDPAELARWTEIHEMIQRLPDDLRETVNLLWYHDLSQAEAAQVLGVAEKTVNRRWLRARLQLGEFLSE
jgi:RNA polymerase sigma factor (sigma-70 family)